MSFRRSGSSGRVHFPEGQVTPEHAGEIVVQLSPDQMHADAHLGFLQVRNSFGLSGFDCSFMTGWAEGRGC